MVDYETYGYDNQWLWPIKTFPSSDIEIKEKSINNNKVVKVIPINKKEEDKKRAEIYKQILNRKLE